MKKNLFYLFLISALTFSLAAVSLAQNTARDVSAGGSKYVISAEAGGVNYVQGDVRVLTNNSSRLGSLLKGDNLKIGEEIMTGKDGKVEILLNPGSFVRLGANSDFEFESTSLDNLKLQLNRGSAMFEIITDDDFKISVKTPKAEFYLVKSGIYRLDVLADGTGRLEVRKGRAQIGNTAATKIKKKKAAIFDGDEVAIEKFDRDDKDSLERWSEFRSEQLADANAQLSQRNLRNTLISGFNNNAWSFYNTFGLWAYSPQFGGYCFLPFGYGWNSPYGYSYPWNIWSYRFPTYLYNQQVTQRRRQINTRRNPVAGRDQDRRPPFTRINDRSVVRNNGRTNSGNTGIRNTDSRNTNTRSPFPTNRRVTIPRSTVPRRTTPAQPSSPRRTSPSIPRPSRGNN